jgi:hypothetical protein
MKKTITAAVLAAVVGGCSSGDARSDSRTLGAAPSFDAPFLIVERKGEEEGIRVRSGGQKNESFYVAIKRSELDKKWFLSAFMKQFHPGAVDYGAARSLGTRVVSFKIQNGKLFVFDVG